MTRATGIDPGDRAGGEVVSAAWDDEHPPVIVYHDWLEEPARALEYLRHRLPWEHREFRDGVKMPRVEALLGPPGSAYTYSGVRYAAGPLPGHPVERLVTRVNALLGTEFNSVSANLYRDGADSIGWHRDDELVLGPPEDIEIASLSLGARRPFQMRLRVGERQFVRRTWELGEGDLMHMRAGCQCGWEHRAPKVDGHIGERIALTFRRFEL